MKIGKNTLITVANTTVTESATAELNRDAENLLDPNSLVLWQVEGASETALYEFAPPIAPDMVALFNIEVDSAIQIDVYSAYPGTISDTVTVTTANLRGLDAYNIYLDVTAATIEAIKITVTGTGATSLSSAGWLWAGEVINFGCAEEMQPFDHANDAATITRSNAVDTNPSYLYQTYNITLKKEAGYEELRTKTRALLVEGYTVPRPYLINEPFLTTPEILLGILDSGKIGYDAFYMKDETGEDFAAQVTIGIRETTGAVNVD